ncbi:MAG: nicotinate-nucleotide--dimethylbenzimidazole phosphoribosyltransferase [Actinomycetes bacterium]
MSVDLATLLARIGPVDVAAQDAARARQDRLTKPRGALGRLEDLSIWLAGVQGRCPPARPQRVRVVVFAADHGVAEAGVSAYPQEVTGQMVANFLAGGAAVNVLADLVGASVRVVDIAVAHPSVDVPTEVTRHHVRDSSGRIDVTDALSADETDRAVAVGLHIADDEVDSGADLLIPGDMGIANTTPATALITALTGRDAASLVGRGTGVDDAQLAVKADVVRRATARVADISDPLTLLARIGGGDVAATTGFLLGAAARRTPVLLDGIVSAAAALVAARLCPAARAWWYAGHRSTEPAQTAALEAVGLEPLVDLGLRLGEGTGALLAVPMVRAAVATLTEMATFDDAGVSDRDG